MAEEYKILGETPDKKKKADYWQAAMGMQQVDGLKPSAYLVELAQQNVNGVYSHEMIEQFLYKKYETETEEEKRLRIKEADLVSARIAAVLDGGDYAVSPMSLMVLHKELFRGIYGHAGEIRKYNIAKDEPVLNNRSVVYADYKTIQATLKYDFDEEKNSSYKAFKPNQIISRLAKFTSSIWQVHPFMEGNTRTTAVFIELYLQKLGFHVNNEPFKEHSTYFRNALVVSNYASLMEGIIPDFNPLEKFFGNLLLGETHLLRNRDLYVLPCFSEAQQEQIKAGRA